MKTFASGAISSKLPISAGKTLYGILFVAVLPATLAVWAAMTNDIVRAPAIQSFPIGLIIAVCGLVITVSGMAAIYFYGKGLPMNAYPPERFVSEGPYWFLAHPIYTGFSLLCLGVAIAFGSSSGFWLVSPTVVLGCLALVVGYENEATTTRFRNIESRPFIHFPRKGTQTPSLSDRISTYIFAFTPLMILCFAAPKTVAGSVLVSLAGIAPILAVPVIAATGRDLRDFAVFGLTATSMAALLFIAFPHGLHSSAIGSSQIAWTFIAAHIFARRFARWQFVIYGLAFLIAIFGFSEMHSFAQIPLGLVIFGISLNIRKLWAFALTLTEKVANSWTEWRFGPVRIINHGIYAGLGAFVSLSIIGTLTGPDHVPYVIFVVTAGVVVSALSAQWIEGSSRLLRPYGWYGGMLGSISALAIVKLAGGSPWLIFAAFCVGAPWGQAAGRLRCLVQGCCHGREVSDGNGIRYTHPRSRVCKLSGMAGVPVHATPLYSILINAVVAVISLRLWLQSSPLSLIVGVYLILTGLGRFVEESLRGEPQTPRMAGLRLYQWTAVGTVLLGMIVTMIGSTTSAPVPFPNLRSVAAAAIFGIFVWIAFGVDFPDSNRRFARLA
ncbi:MAG: prolipoprotein diacylglyceryl transferase family protein [Pyrinomonadaceae bacterium]